MRKEEDLEWATHFKGSLSFQDLCLKDAPLRLLCSEDAVCGLAADVKDPSLQTIEQALLGADAYMIPLALGKHVDHVTAREAFLRLHLHAGTPVAFYEDLPYASRPGADEERKPIVASLPMHLMPAFVQSPTVISDSIAFKRQLSLGYSTQIDSIVANDIASFCSRYQGRERLWVNAGWSAAFESLVAHEAIGEVE